MNRAGTSRRSQAGFSLVELLVTLVLISLMALWGFPTFLSTLARLRVTNTAREAAIFMQIARMEAAKRSVDTRVIYQNGAGSLIGKPSLLAFADLDDDGAFNTADDRVLAGPYELPPGVDLWGPLDTAAEEAGSVVGWCTAPPATDCGPTFSSDGSASSVGAFRFRDSHGNFLEARIEFVGTAKVVLQKWFGPTDTTADWFENGESGNRWAWW
jgi:prepilin-type N-terminal cleavage/methylation domain-containing protein